MKRISNLNKVMRAALIRIHFNTLNTRYTQNTYALLNVVHSEVKNPIHSINIIVTRLQDAYLKRNTLIKHINLKHFIHFIRIAYKNRYYDLLINSNSVDYLKTKRLKYSY